MVAIGITIRPRARIPATEPGRVSPFVELGYLDETGNRSVIGLREGVCAKIGMPLGRHLQRRIVQHFPGRVALGTVQGPHFGAGVVLDKDTRRG